MKAVRNRKFHISPVVTLLFTIGSIFCAAVPSVRGQEGYANEIESAIASVKPALVRIRIAEVDYYDGREVKSESSGSGVIISKEGHIVTNHHVAGWAKRIVCTLSDKEEVEADLVGTDPLTDIAVVKLRGEPGREYPVAKWGDSPTLKVGDRVLAMGSPLALSQSVTMGIVSNTEMTMPEHLEGAITLDGEDVGSMVRWIGHDADIFPGNSGGPLVNLKGEIVGINEISLALAGAIPSNIARDIAETLISKGKVPRAWFGMGVQPLLKGSKCDRGVLVSGVIPGGPADKAGIKAGDIIVKVAGNDVTVKFNEQLPVFNRMVAALPVAKESDVVAIRGDKEMLLKITPQLRPETEPRPKEFRHWGMCGSDLSIIMARELKRSNQDGIVVWSIRPGGACFDAKPSIAEGDVIVSVDGKPVKSMADLAALTEEVTNGKDEPTPVLVAFERKAEHLLTVAKVGVRNLEDPGREVRKAYVPISTQVLTTDLAEALGVEGRTGVRVTQVYPESEASKAGLKVGDLIVALDGEPIDANQPEDIEVLPAMVRQYKIGSKVELTVIRGKEEMIVPIVLPESPLLPREMKKYRDDNFEFTARDIASRDRMSWKLDKEVIGVYVESVSEGGWAALGRLRVGDIITEVDGERIDSVSQLRQLMEKIEEQKPRHVVLRVRRGLHELYVELEADWDNAK